MKRAVITGATGAIGTALIEKLTRKNVEVLVLLREGSVRNSKISKSPLVKTAYCSLNEIKNFNLSDNEEYDAFFHLAWDGTYGSDRNDMLLQSKNIEYTLDTVKLAERLGCKVFVGAGSQAEYGRVQDGVKLSADTPCNPENGYGIAKLAAGSMSRVLCSQLGIRHEWGRILSVYGPNDGERSLVMSTIIKCLNNEKCPLTKGEQQWDYLYSGDVADAFYLMAEKGVDGKTYTVGSGRTRTLKEFVRIIRDSTNKASILDFGAIPYCENQVMYLCADISELQKDTGFEPETDFEQGILNTVKWYKENYNG